MSDIEQCIADILFVETARIVFAYTGNDELSKRVAAVMSMSAKQLADAVVSELELTQEWSNAYEKAGDGWVWRSERTGAFPSRSVPEANMRLQDSNPAYFMRNMRIETRYVTEWVPE